MAKVLKINDAGWLLAETSRTPAHVGVLATFSMPEDADEDYLEDLVTRWRDAAHLPAALQLPPQEPAGAAPLGAARRRGHRPRLPPAPLRGALARRRARARCARLAAALVAAGPDLPAVGVPRHRGRRGAAVVDVHEGPPLPDRRRRRDPPGQPDLLRRPRGTRHAAALGGRHPRHRPVRAAAEDQAGREGRHRGARRRPVGRLGRRRASCRRTARARPARATSCAPCPGGRRARSSTSASASRAGSRPRPTRWTASSGSRRPPTAASTTCSSRSAAGRCAATCSSWTSCRRAA